MCPKPSYEVLEKRVRELEQQSAELKHSREALQKCEMRFRDLMENAKDSIFVIQEGMIKFANSSAIALTGYTAEELTRIPFANLIHPEDRENFTDKHLRLVKGEAVVDNYTFRVLPKTGAGAWQQINSFSITWDRRPAALSFIRDLTQAKQLEKQLIESQKMAAISTLAGEIAHDFNNLMTTIQGNVSLMLFDIPVSHPNYQNLINIEKQIQSGTRLTSQLLGFAKQGKYQLHSLDINNLVENKVWQPAEAAAESMQGCGTILLVDDEASVLNVGVQLLGKLGYEVIKADSGRKAVKLFEENQDNIDLVISDMVMPGMNGGEVFDRIRQIKGDANFLLASGYSAEGQASEILNRGCNGFIQKPFTLKQLARKIREVLVPAENRAKK